MESEKRRFFLVVNLIAGQGRCKTLFPKVKAELDRRRIDYDVHYTNEPLEATDAARMGLEAGFEYLVAVGGDGTVNEVVNGIVGSKATLGVIPAGTGNDFVRMVGIPSDPFRAIDVLVRGRPRRIDLGRVADDRYFVNGLGIGIDAQVARDVLEMKRLRGALAYLAAAVKEVFRFQPFPVTLTIDGTAEERTYLSLGFANGKFCGGGFKLAPRALLTDGMIDVAGIEDFPKLVRLLRLPQARAGAHLGLRQVHYRQVREVTASSDADLVAHMDGEAHKLRKPSFRVEAVPDALTLLSPS